MENKSPKTVGPKEGLGSGIAALGLVFILLPSLSAQIAAGNNATLVSILTGALWLFGLSPLSPASPLSLPSLTNSD